MITNEELGFKSFPLRCLSGDPKASVDMGIGDSGFGGPIAPALRVDDETAPLLGSNDVFLSWRSCGLGLDTS